MKLRCPALRQPGDPAAFRDAANGGAGALIDPGLQDALCAARQRRRRARIQFALDGERRLDPRGGRARLSALSIPGRLYAVLAAVFRKTSTPNSRMSPTLSVFRADNRSSYDALSVHLQGNVSRFNLVANYTLSSAKTWGCVLGELFDYVNGVCNPLHAFAPGDYGPSGEDVTHRFVLAGTVHLPGGFESLDVDPGRERPAFHAHHARGRQRPGRSPRRPRRRQRRSDLPGPVPRHAVHPDRFARHPAVQFPRALAGLAVRRVLQPVQPQQSRRQLCDRHLRAADARNNLSNATAFCLNAACTQTQPITSPNQLRVPAGALGDFFGPGTTVGIPFAAQIGVRLSF